MTIRTTRAEAQECAVQRSGPALEPPDILRNYPFRLVARSAINFLVLTTEGVPRRVMWEKVCIKMHHSEIFSEMFFMATATFFIGK